MSKKVGWKLPTRGDKDRVGETDGEFSVCQFFENDTYEYVRRWVSAEEAMAAFKFYTNNVAVKMGVVKRVIITDGGDCTNAEWKLGEGLTYPKQEQK
jgi:hypothetical protein